MKNSILFLLLVFSKLNFAQDIMQELSTALCGTEEETGNFCNNRFDSYFPMDDTLRALVVFANYPNGNYDPVTINSNLIFMQYWPGTNNQHLQKPSWADSVICPTTTNVWNPSLTGLLKESSHGKFWLIGDVYNSLVVLDHDYEYYSPPNGRHIGYAVKEILDEIAQNVNFSNYDNYDPCDIDNDDNRKEPDGTVDFIFIVFRFNISVITDPLDGRGYTGTASLGGHNKNFGDSVMITRNGKKISANYPGSGCISDMYHKWFIGIPNHEFTQHYGISGGHSYTWGSQNVTGFGLASEEDRLKLGWSFGNSYHPSTNTLGINLRDYVTTGDNISFNRWGKGWHIVNLRRLNYYSTSSFHSWRWTMNELLLPMQRIRDY